MKLISIIGAGTVVGAVLAGTVGLTAQAGVACDVSRGAVCGKVYNSPHSKTSINVYSNWLGGNQPLGRPIGVTPGFSSRNVGINDAEGFCVPIGRTAFVAVMKPTKFYSMHVRGCLKVDDTTVMEVRVL